MAAAGPFGLQFIHHHLNECQDIAALGSGVIQYGEMCIRDRGKVTGESAIKPEYTGSGMLVLEPTYKHLLLMDAADWGGSVVLDDGLFLACDSSLKHKAVMRSNFSSAVAGRCV